MLVITMCSNTNIWENYCLPSSKLAAIFNSTTKISIFSIDPSKVLISFNSGIFDFFFFQNTLNNDSGEPSTVSPAKSCWISANLKNWSKSSEPSSPTPCSRPRSSSPMSLGLQRFKKKKKKKKKKKREKKKAC
jgi:hypothetical protein